MNNNTNEKSKIYTRDEIAEELGFPIKQAEQETIEDKSIETMSESPGESTQSVSHEIDANIAKKDDLDPDYNPDFNPLTQFAVNEHFAGLEEAPEVKKYLGGMVAAGEITLIFAAAGVGKTLCTLGLMAEDISAGLLDPRYVGYINKDDSGQGIREKVQLATELGFHMISDAHKRPFDGEQLKKMTNTLIGRGDAPKSLIIIDTVKKFHDVNDKKSTVGFYKALRPFTLAGGTVIGLAHTNKFTDGSGRSVYAGTADNVQDVDAAYVGDVIVKADVDSSLHVVRFTQIKGRLANNAPLHCGFSAGGNLTWRQRLKTLHMLVNDDLVKIQQKHERKIDDEVISSIKLQLWSNISMSKMELVKAVTEATVKSRREVLAVLDRYTGSDPKLHLWNFEMGHRGAKNYQLLDGVYVE